MALKIIDGSIPQTKQSFAETLKEWQCYNCHRFVVTDNIPKCFKLGIENTCTNQLIKTL